MPEMKGYLQNSANGLFYSLQGEGEPIILLHGGFTDHRIWDDQVSALAAKFQVVRYDQRGYGHSEIPEKPFSYYEDLKSVFTL